MNIKKEIKLLITKEGTTLTAVASKLYGNKEKRKALNLLSQKLRNNTVKFEEIKNILDILGYKFEIKQK